MTARNAAYAFNARNAGETAAKSEHRKSHSTRKEGRLRLLRATC